MAAITGSHSLGGSVAVGNHSSPLVEFTDETFSYYLQVIVATQAYVDALKDNLNHIQELMEDNDLDFNDKVQSYSF